MLNPIMRLAAIALTGTAIATSPAAAQVKLPPTVTMTAYDTGTSGFNITVAVGKMFKDKYGSDTRVLPAGNDVARLQPLRLHRASISAMGVGSISRRKAYSNSRPGNGDRSRSRSR
jgi:ABC-type thiamine transport system substrate-binding protein